MITSSFSSPDGVGHGDIRVEVVWSTTEIVEIVRKLEDAVICWKVESVMLEIRISDC